MSESKQYRRKQDGHVVGPLTAAEAKELAGFSENEWDPVEPYKPERTVDDEPKPKAAPAAKRKTAAKAIIAKSSAVKASEPAPVAAAVDKGAGDGNEA